MECIGKVDLMAKIITTSLIFLLSLLAVCSVRANNEEFPEPPTEDRSWVSWFSVLGESESKKLFSEGKELFDKGKHDRAALVFGRIAQSGLAKAKEAHSYVAKCHHKRGDHKRTISWGRAFLSRYKATAEVLWLLANSHAAQKHYDKQVNVFERLIDLTPNDPELHLQLAVAYDKIDKPNKTVEHAQRAVQIDSSYKKRLQPIIRNSNVARRIGNIITSVLRETETSQLTDEQIDEYARRVGEILGDDPYKRDFRDTFKRYRMKSLMLKKSKENEN